MGGGTEERGRGEGRGNKSAPVGAPPAGTQRSEPRKVRATSPAQRLGASGLALSEARRSWEKSREIFENSCFWLGPKGSVGRSDLVKKHSPALGFGY